MKLSKHREAPHTHGVWQRGHRDRDRDRANRNSPQVKKGMVVAAEM